MTYVGRCDVCDNWRALPRRPGNRWICDACWDHVPVECDRLRAEEWVVQGVPSHGEVVGFLRAIHYAKGAPNTSTYRHGLYRDTILVGDLMGVALWIPPTKIAAQSVDADWQGVLSLSRFAVHPEAPKNAASFLLGASMRLVDRERWPTLLTYADTSQGHTGGIYKATNWECMGETAAGDTWIDGDGQQRGRKRGRFTMTAAQMTAAGMTRQPSLPKIKFVHRAKRRRRPLERVLASAP